MSHSSHSKATGHGAASAVTSEVFAPDSPSKRWHTTCHDAMVDTASRLGTMDRRGMVEDLRNRKIANTKTSINFGHDEIRYVSDLRDSESAAARGLNAEERAANLERIRKMKADLTTTSFCLGDEKVEYSTTNADATKARSVSGPVTIIRPKQTSSIYFGMEKPLYMSSNAEAMQYHGNVNNFTKSREEVTALKAHLRKHNFSLGEEPPVYITDYASGFNAPKQTKSYDQIVAEKEASRKKIEMSRSSLISFGQDSVEYISDTHRMQKGSSGISLELKEENAAMAANIKSRLQKQSIVIGDDPEYY